ncbi:MAG: hypothetical protein PHN22_04575 [Candidatus ainarchaeum sp.]|nr:hypothetical protein [Candidatus ainarchaeum sp.]
MWEKIIKFIESFKLVELVYTLSDKTDDFTDNFSEWLFLIKFILFLITRRIILIPGIFILIIILLGWNIFWIILGIWIVLELIYKFTEETNRF